MTTSNWTYHYATDDFTCDACGYDTTIEYTQCPKCGATMLNAVESLRRIREDEERKNGL